jgi:protein phosphatase
MTFVARSESAEDVAAAYVSDRGHVRALNNDSVFFAPDRGLFIVSDGMGAQESAGLASRIVVRVLPSLVLRRLNESGDPVVDGASALGESIPALSIRLRRETEGKSGLSGLGATVVALLIRDAHALIAHLGDSRAYLLRSGKTTLLTRDHSVTQVLLEEEEISSDEARRHSARGKLSRYVGMEGDAPPDLKSMPIVPGDRFLLCSDGLYRAVDDAGIGQILRAHLEPNAAAMALVARANGEGGKDNITAIVLDWKGLL